MYLLMKLLYLNSDTSNHVTNTSNITNYITHNSNTILLTTQDTYNYYNMIQLSGEIL